MRRLGFLLVFAVGLSSIAPLGTPVHLSYVYSDSMEPTFDVGDGYILVPGGDVETGDIVTFWSDERGSYATHRVVGRSEAGYLTKGDNNPTTDQRSGYSAVRRDDIVGEVLTVGGSPVVVPQLGTAVTAARSAPVPVIAGLFAALLVYAFRRSNAPRRSTPDRVGEVLRPVFLAGFVAITFALAVGGTAHEVTYVATTVPANDASNVMALGASKSTTVVVEGKAWPLMQRVVDTSGMVASNRTFNATSVRVTGTVQAPSSPGPVPVRVVVKQYPAVLPRSVIDRLVAVSPVLASGASAAAVLAPIWALARVLVDPETALRRRPSRWWRLLRGKDG